MMNLVSHRSFARKRELKDFYEDFRRGRWNDFTHLANIATVDAYYNQASNTMIVPIGMLQPPLFWTRPKSLTFGAFGIVVGEFYPIYKSLKFKEFALAWEYRIANFSAELLFLPQNSHNSMLLLKFIFES